MSAAERGGWGQLFGFWDLLVDTISPEMEEDAERSVRAGGGIALVCEFVVGRS